MSKHKDFILSPITLLMEDVVSANGGVGNGIETFPLCDYIMQSLFLRMTGSQEQKLKCICWELANNDYEYRYDHTKNHLGGRSHYNDKLAVYQDLIKQIKKYDATFDISAIKKADVLSTAISEVKDIFINTNLSIWAQNSFNEFEIILGSLKNGCFSNTDIDLNTTSMFIRCDNCSKYDKKAKPKQCSNTSNIQNLIDIYENYLFRHRNKIAHNTQSYQQNLPTLKTLMDESYKYENYFVWFSILVLIDEIIMSLYKTYSQALKNNI